MDGRQRSWEDGPEAESGVEEISAALLEVLKQQASERLKSMPRM